MEASSSITGSADWAPASVTGGVVCKSGISSICSTGDIAGTVEVCVRYISVANAQTATTAAAINRPLMPSPAPCRTGQFGSEASYPEDIQ